MPKQKNKIRKPGDFSPRSNNGVAVQKHITRLGEVLQRVYTDGPSLDTTMTCKCVCCKIAMPQINYCEFVQIAMTYWPKLKRKSKIDMICTSMRYFFRHEFSKWGIMTLIKPCMFLNKKSGRCEIYKDRPLNCKMYGLWPKEEYEKRVDRFVKAYAEYGLVREDLPNHFQCPLVKRIDDSEELTTEVISKMYAKLDEIDKSISSFTDLQVKNRENYRTFHDWLLLSIFGEQWLSDLTSFMKFATADVIEDQIEKIGEAIKESGKDLNPTIR